MYVVIGTSPAHDNSIAVGPFRSLDRAHDAADALTAKGYVSEMVPLTPLADVDDSPGWDETP